MPHAAVNGQNIHYQDTGGDGPAVVLGHGFLMDLEMFAPQVEALRGTYRVITWDERGFGRTEFDGKPFSYWDSAADCLALMDHLGVQRAVVGGMSQGGFLSLRTALTAPDRVRALILLDTQAGAEHPEVAAAYQGMIDMWASVGPVDELAGTVANIIIAERPDVVVVGSPPGYHFAQSKAALEAGADVMCEKPFTLNPADAWELDATTKRTGKQLFVSYGWNYRPMVIQAHRLMHEDVGIGEIEHVSIHMD